MCLKGLALPIIRLARCILRAGVWPDVWLNHWICALYKKLSPSNPENYRGIQLTAQISKVMERCIGHLFQLPLQISGAFGPNQFAYSKGRGARDALLFLILTWLQAFANGQKVGVYCSDVSGAFDKVSSEKLLQKLSSQGVHPSVINVLESWLAKRRANVVVGGVESVNILMQDMVYQGTVWGPVLWNSFFADAVRALIKAQFESIVYADDLNAYRLFPNQTEQSVIDRSLRSCQDELHKWGRGNRVTFDPKKESFHTVSRVHPQGDGFKILGIAFDCQLLMHDTIDELCTQCCWKVRTLLRSRRFFTTGEIVLHFKSHILSFIEYRTPAITHAADSAIASVNGVQARFLRDIGVSALDALHI